MTVEIVNVDSHDCPGCGDSFPRHVLIDEIHCPPCWESMNTVWLVLCPDCNQKFPEHEMCENGVYCESCWNAK